MERTESYLIDENSYSLLCKKAENASVDVLSMISSGRGYLSISRCMEPQAALIDELAQPVQVQYKHSIEIFKSDSVKAVDLRHKYLKVI